MDDTIIKLENISLWYNKDKPNQVQALRNISLEIKRGDYTAFFGPSGCGKTTMLYAISGIDRLQEGKIIINDRDLSFLSNKELAIFRQTGIGIIFQQFNLVPSLTVIKNVALPMLFIGVTSEKSEEEARKLLERLNITDLANRYPFELSGGQQQRVGIARALANDPPIIIADEPLGNLDSVNAKNVLNFLKELNEKDGRTVIMVTHEAWSLRDVKTIFHMKDGAVDQIEKMEEGDSLSDHLKKNLNKQLSSIGSENTNTENDHSVEQYSAHIVSNFLLRGYSIDEINRFEGFVRDLFTDKIKIEEFKKMIDKPFSEGGLGLWKKKTQRIAEYVSNIIEKRKDIGKIIEIIEKDSEASIFDDIKSIRDWIIDGYTGKLNSVQISAIDQVISDRIRGFISENEVSKILDLSNNKFGVGLSFRASHLMSEKLEIILAGENTLNKKNLSL